MLFSQLFITVNYIFEKKHKIEVTSQSFQLSQVNKYVIE